MSVVKSMGEVIVGMLVGWNGNNYVDTSGSSDDSPDNGDDASGDT